MRLSSLSEAAPTAGHRNEDAFFARREGDQVFLLVADGAGQRLKTTKTAALFDRFGPECSAARFASQTMRETMAEHYRTNSPRELLLRANAALYAAWCSVYGEMSVEALIQQEPQLAAELEADPRRIRLALPVCVATVARLSLADKQLEFAHAGDTALLLFHRDGRVISLVPDQMGPHDADALNFARVLQARKGAAHLAQVLDDPQVRAINRGNGLYHNYEDENGDPDPALGVGVLDGLPQLEHYLYSGTVDLNDVSGILLCSDGFQWPAPLDESEAEQAARYRLMREHVENAGLDRYYEALRAEEAADRDRDRYPRFKIHDNSTAVYLEDRLMHDVFISYSRKDETVSNEIKKRLEASLKAQKLIPWSDKQLHAGEDWYREITRSILQCQAMVVILSPEAAASEWVKYEFRLAAGLRKPIFMILTAVGMTIPTLLARTQIIHFDKDLAVVDQVVNEIRQLDLPARLWNPMFEGPGLGSACL